VAAEVEIIIREALEVLVVAGQVVLGRLPPAQPTSVAEEAVAGRLIQRVLEVQG
jgi:hypothetical protein